MTSLWMTIKMVPLRATILSLLLVTSIVILTVSHQSLNSLSPAAESVDLRSSAHQAALAKHARNASLGFGEIVYISMPDRTDRQDAMNLLASSSGLKLKLSPGVNGSHVSPKAIPDEAPQGIRPSVLGCYRAHANAWRYLLESDMDSILIFEDDLDWNPNIKDTMETLSMQMQNSKIRVKEPSDYERANAPYGLDWDILYVGSWRHGTHPDYRDVTQIWDDPDLPDGAILNSGIKYSVGQALKDYGLTDEEFGKKRVLAPSYWTLKTTAYAITRQGAQRLLFLLSYAGNLKQGDIDQDITRLFEEGKLRGYTLTPPAFSQFKVGGTKDSDNIKEGTTTEGKGNLGGQNFFLKGSARQMMLDKLKLDNWEEYRRFREE
ncbi:hypothetical protein V1508DRAFT_408192 [Lipomyces doorenjongii]|uniref:uncharacterized protein n=1 Tax=Lipomyces doorenjongii TaxID=383834 RepID=UPI0034CE5B10